MAEISSHLRFYNNDHFTTKYFPVILVAVYEKIAIFSRANKEKVRGAALLHEYGSFLMSL